MKIIKMFFKNLNDSFPRLGTHIFIYFIYFLQQLNLNLNTIVLKLKVETMEINYEANYLRNYFVAKSIPYMYMHILT